MGVRKMENQYNAPNDDMFYGPNSPYAGMEPKKQKSNPLPKILIGVITVGLLLGIGIYVFLNYFSKPGDRILMAATNTLSGNQFATAAGKATKLAKEKKFGANVNGSLRADGETFYINSEFGTDLDAKQISGKGSVTFGEYSFDFGLYMDDSRINLSMPSVFSSKLVYDYTQIPTGYLKSLEDSMDGITFAEINDVLSDSWEQSNNSAKFLGSLLLETRKNINELEWQKADKKSCTYKNKTVNAGGFKTTVTSDTLAKWIRSYSNLYTDYMEDTLGSGYMSLLDQADTNPVDAFEDLAEALEELDGSCDVEVYIADKRIVDLVISEDGETSFEMVVKGGNYPFENVDFITQDATVSLEGTTNGSEETVDLIADGMKLGSYSYDSRSGDYSVRGSEGSAITGRLDTSGDDITFTIDSLAISGETIDCNFEYSITTSPAINRDSAVGTELLLNTATEEDIEKLAMEIVYKYMF